MRIKKSLIISCKQKKKKHVVINRKCAIAKLEQLFEKQRRLYILAGANIACKNVYDGLKVYCIIDAVVAQVSKLKYDSKLVNGGVCCHCRRFLHSTNGRVDIPQSTGRWSDH